MNKPIRILKYVAVPALVALLGCNEDPPATTTSSGAGGAGSSSSGSSGSGSTSSGSGGGSDSSSSSSSSGAGGSGTSSSSSGSGSSSSGGGVTPIMIVNPGFEADVVADGKYTDAVIPAGWMVYDPNSIIGQDYNSVGVLNPTGTVLYPGGAPEGKNVSLTFLWRKQTDGKAAGLSQELSHTLLPDTQYTLRVKVGNIAPEPGGVAYDLNGFPGYRVELLAGGTVLASDNNTLAPGEGMFLQSVVTFATGSNNPQLGQKVQIRLLNLNKADSGIEVNYDDVELEAAPIP